MHEPLSQEGDSSSEKNCSGKFNNWLDGPCLARSPKPIAPAAALAGALEESECSFSGAERDDFTNRWSRFVSQPSRFACVVCGTSGYGCEGISCFNVEFEHGKHYFPFEVTWVRVYEESGEHRGVTGNLSAAGVYIRADAALEVGSNVEFEITLPPEVTGAKENVVVQCRGRVVRSDEPAGNAAESRGVACVIDTYDFVRR